MFESKAGAQSKLRSPFQKANFMSTPVTADTLSKGEPEKGMSAAEGRKVDAPVSEVITDAKQTGSTLKVIQIKIVTPKHSHNSTF